MSILRGKRKNLPTEQEADLPATGSRVTKGLIALYEFKEKQGR